MRKTIPFSVGASWRVLKARAEGRLTDKEIEEIEKKEGIRDMEVTRNIDKFLWNPRKFDKSEKEDYEKDMIVLRKLQKSVWKA